MNPAVLMDVKGGHVRANHSNPVHFFVKHYFLSSRAIEPEVPSISGRFVPDEVAHASFDKAPSGDWSRAGLFKMDEWLERLEHFRPTE